MSNLLKVTEVEHYTDTLFRIRTERPTDYQFRAGEFTMIGMGDDDTLRAYSYACGPDDPYLEFYSIKVPNGPLTSRLQHVQFGDEIEVWNKPTGSLVLDNLEPGGNLWLLATGTGIAPFISLLKEPKTYENYDQVHIVWSVRYPGEILSYHEFLQECPANYFPTVTREEFVNVGRIQHHIQQGTIFNNATPKTDRVMVCGSIEFNKDIKQMLVDIGYTEGTKKSPGNFVVERAFVRK